MNPTNETPSIDQILIDHRDAVNRGASMNGLVEAKALIEKREQEATKPLLSMLDKLGVEKCPVCSEHLIDDDMTICENCSYGVHEWCAGYTYDGDGEYPAESAYAICKPCYRKAERKKIEKEASK